MCSLTVASALSKGTMAPSSSFSFEMSDSASSGVSKPISRALEEKVLPTPVVVNQPPNGGFKAWMQVFGAFLLFFNSW